MIRFFVILHRRRHGHREETRVHLRLVDKEVVRHAESSVHDNNNTPEREGVQQQTTDVLEARKHGREVVSVVGANQ